jgi:Ser/Thr protein kinase RdoA (MazF antagonist)
MLKETVAIYTDAIKAQAAYLYGVDSGSLEPLEGFENFVYACDTRVKPCILRLTHSLHRPAAHIQGEVTWVNSLAEHGIPVAPALPSLAGNFTEIIPDENSGTYFTAVAFGWAPGVLLDDHPEEKALYWNGHLFEQWGQLLGRIHNHAQYHAPYLDIQRPQWYEYDVLHLEHFIPAEQTLVLEVARSHLKKLHGLPVSPSVHGLTHADLTQWNFHVDDGVITVFDFDSTEYGWFVKDLAVSLYYADASYEGDDLDIFRHEFLTQLVTGYCQVRPISASWLERIPDFLFLQRIILYSYCHQIGDHVNPTEDDRVFLKKTRKILESGEEPIKLDFSSIQPDLPPKNPQ